jgi:GDP-mannose transporter
VIITLGGSAALCGASVLSPWPPPRALLRAYGLYSALFVLGIYTNMRSLEASNVDTVVVFRTAVPLLVAGGDYLLMGRAAPSSRSAAALLAIIGGAAAFVAVDSAFHADGVRAYAWVGAYCLTLAAEMLLGKAITSQHEASLGASVLLTNGYALAPFLAIGAATGELSRGLDAALYTPHACAVLALSCALSAGIGFSSWWARDLLSATTFTVVGTVNKVLTVLINILFWNKHATPLGTAFLLVCLAGGAAYQQAPMRAAVAAAAEGGGGGGGAAAVAAEEPPAASDTEAAQLMAAAGAAAAGGVSSGGGARRGGSGSGGGAAV